tara:strand:- start:2645 stop:3025 length:381 start_codon:yes stop_codon:yes gene_type:complete
MAYTQDDFDVFTVRPKKAIRNSDGERVVEDYTDAEWDEAKAECQKLIDDYSDNLFAAIRHTRTNLLNQSDWAVVSDSPLSAADIASVKTWRQELRDLPTEDADPDNITVPDCPVASLGIIVVQPSV